MQKADESPVFEYFENFLRGSLIKDINPSCKNIQKKKNIDLQQDSFCCFRVFPKGGQNFRPNDQRVHNF